MTDDITWSSGCLVLSLAGKNVAMGFTPSEIWNAIQQLHDDDVAAMLIERLPGPRNMFQPQDRTLWIAERWAQQFNFGAGIEPADYLAPFPAFVRYHLEAGLIVQWEALHQNVVIGDFKRPMTAEQVNALKSVAMQIVGGQS